MAPKPVGSSEGSMSPALACSARSCHFRCAVRIGTVRIQVNAAVAVALPQPVEPGIFFGAARKGIGCPPLVRAAPSGLAGHEVTDEAADCHI